MTPTASILHIHLACRLAGVLPVAKRTSAYADEGTVFHKFFHQVVELQRGGLSFEDARTRAIEESPVELQAALRLVQLEALQLDPGAFAPEAAFAFDLETGKARELGRGMERDYSSAKPTELCGTIDRAALKSDGGAYVGDYKRWGYTAKACHENPQMLFAALSVARAWGAKYVDAEIVRIDDDGEPWSDHARFEAFDLDRFEIRLIDLATRIAVDRAALQSEAALPEATLGDHCTYCPSLPYCPAKAMLAHAVIGQGSAEITALAAAAKEGKLEQLITRENAARIYALVKQAEPLLEAVKSVVRDLARVEPIQLQDGSVLGPVPWPTREVTDGAKAAAVIREQLGEKAEKAATQVKVTLDGINAGVKAWLVDHQEENRRGVIGEKEDQLFGLLLKRGLARHIQGVQIRAKKPKSTTKREAA